MRPAADTLRLSLDYQPPLAWDALLSFLGGRGAAGVEAVVDGRYLRTVRLDGAEGWLAVSATATGVSFTGVIVIVRDFS